MIITPLYSEEGALLGFVKVMRDISERRKAVEAIQALNADLLRRTAELEASNKELEGFSYSVAHDLRSPLRSVDGFSKYLLEHTAVRLNPQEQDYLQRMRMAAQRMGRLIDDLLNLARISRMPMKRVTVDLSALAGDIAANLHTSDPERRVTFDISPDIKLCADRELLRMAVAHLLDNAWKFSGMKEEARITVGILHRDDQPVYYIKDNGVGFNMAYIDKLFQPFHRLHTEEEFPGTGIGLALVQRIIQRHGGRVWRRSEGTGRHILFYHRGAKVNEPIILLVEDNRDDAELTRLALQDSKVANRLVWVHDGQEALDWLYCTGKYAGRDPCQIPSVVLLDLKLPKIMGLEVLERIRQEPRTRRLPVVILTSSKEEQDLIHGYELGANSYVRKPVDFDQFTQAIKELGIYWMVLNEPAPPREKTGSGQ